MSSIVRFFIFLSFLLNFLVSDVAFAWGERGHDLITRTATRRLATIPDAAQLHAVMLKKEHMLGHLSNVPDIVWRNGSKEVVALNSSTHYVDVDYLTDQPELAKMPTTPADAQKIAASKKLNLEKDVGTSVWRVQQLFDLMVDSFASAAKEKEKPASIKHIDQALLYAGIMAHFVGDMAQPLHARKDYDGWERQQGGIHGYYESDVVDTFGLDWDQDVFKELTGMNPFKTKILKVLNKPSIDSSDDVLKVMWSESIDSYNDAETLFKIDQEKCIQVRSKTDPIKIPAKRIAAADCASHFRKHITGRAALAADVLSNIWAAAWRLGGKPSLSNYRSYTYFISPEFIAPKYLEGLERAK